MIRYFTVTYRKWNLIWIYPILGGGTNSIVATSSNTPSNQVCYSSDGDSDEE